MKKEQDEYLYLTVYSEPEVHISDDYCKSDKNETEWIKMEISTGSRSYPDLIEICLRNDNDKYILTFNITEVTARYIQNYLKTYLEIINN